MKYVRNLNICEVSVFQSHLMRNWTNCTCVYSLTNHQFDHQSGEIPFRLIPDS